MIAHLAATIEYLTDYDLNSIDFENLVTKWTLGHDGSGAHSEFRSTTKDTNNLNLGGIRLIEVRTRAGKLIYRESNFGQETEVPFFIGKYIRSFTKTYIFFLQRILRILVFNIACKNC